MGPGWGDLHSIEHKRFKSPIDDCLSLHISPIVGTAKPWFKSNGYAWMTLLKSFRQRPRSLSFWKSGCEERSLDRGLPTAYAIELWFSDKEIDEWHVTWPKRLGWWLNVLPTSWSFTPSHWEVDNMLLFLLVWRECNFCCRLLEDQSVPLAVRFCFPFMLIHVALNGSELPTEWFVANPPVSI